MLLSGNINSQSYYMETESGPVRIIKTKYGLSLHELRHLAIS